MTGVLYTASSSVAFATSWSFMDSLASLMPCLIYDMVNVELTMEPSMVTKRCAYINLHKYAMSSGFGIILSLQQSLDSIIPLCFNKLISYHYQMVPMINVLHSDIISI